MVEGERKWQEKEPRPSSSVALWCPSELHIIKTIAEVAAARRLTLCDTPRLLGGNRLLVGGIRHHSARGVCRAPGVLAVAGIVGLVPGDFRCSPAPQSTVRQTQQQLQRQQLLASYRWATSALRRCCRGLVPKPCCCFWKTRTTPNPKPQGPCDTHPRSSRWRRCAPAVRETQGSPPVPEGAASTERMPSGHSKWACHLLVDKPYLGVVCKHFGQAVQALGNVRGRLPDRRIATHQTAGLHTRPCDAAGTNRLLGERAQQATSKV